MEAQFVLGSCHPPAIRNSYFQPSHTTCFVSARQNCRLHPASLASKKVSLRSSFTGPKVVFEHNKVQSKVSVPVLKSVIEARDAEQEGTSTSTEVATPKRTKRPAPDLPSLLLNARIIYVGMPLVPAVTELIIGQLLYLQYDDPKKPIIMYINSTGTQNGNGEVVAEESEVFAIVNAMLLMRPPVHTVCVGQAYGAAALLLACGKQGQRAALPNASIMLCQPRVQTQGYGSEMAEEAEIAMENRQLMINLLAYKTGQTYEKIEKDTSRHFYLSPEEAIEYGLLDKVLNANQKIEEKAPLLT